MAVYTAKSTINRSAVVVAIVPATVMQNVDMTIANIALPYIQTALATGPEEISWILTSYILSAAIAMPLAGYIGSRIGPRYVLLAAVAGFTLAALACAAAQTLGQLVFFRLLQGACGAALIPMSQAILLDVYPKEEHNRAMALWGAGVMIGPILGPSLGGYITEVFGWRAIFLVNVPVGIATLLAVFAVVPKDSDLSRRPFDFVGYVLLAMAIISMQLMIGRGASLGWFEAQEVVILLSLVVLFLYLFVVYSMTAKEPFLDPSLFRDQNFTIALVLNSVVGANFFANLAVLPIFVQTIMHYPILTTGVLLVPRGFGMLAGVLVVGLLVRSRDPRPIAVTGVMLICISLYQMTKFSPDTGQWSIVHTGFTHGLGMGLLFVPLTTLAFVTLARHLRTEGAALFNLVRSVSSSIAIGGVFALLASNSQVVRAGLVTHISPLNILFSAPWIPDQWSPETLQGIAAIEAEIAHQAAEISLLNTFRIMLWMTLVCLPFVLLLRHRPKSPAQIAVATQV